MADKQNSEHSLARIIEPAKSQITDHTMAALGSGITGDLVSYLDRTTGDVSRIVPVPSPTRSHRTNLDLPSEMNTGKARKGLFTDHLEHKARAMSPLEDTIIVMIPKLLHGNSDKPATRKGNGSSGANRNKLALRNGNTVVPTKSHSVPAKTNIMKANLAKRFENKTRAMSPLEDSIVVTIPNFLHEKNDEPDTRKKIGRRRGQSASSNRNSVAAATRQIQPTTRSMSNPSQREIRPKSKRRYPDIVQAAEQQKKKRRKVTAPSNNLKQEPFRDFDPPDIASRSPRTKTQKHTPLVDRPRSVSPITLGRQLAPMACAKSLPVNGGFPLSRVTRSASGTNWSRRWGP